MAENTKVSKVALLQKNTTRFFRDIKSELKKVIWPTRKQLVNNTLTVLLTCFLVGAIIWVADQGISHLVQFVLQR